jgi:hypothetical protein
VRHQLRAAVRLDDATRRALRWPERDRLALLTDVIAETGAAFIEANVPLPAPADWDAASPAERRAYLESLRGRLFNADLTPAEVEGARVGFDVTGCRFVALCHELARPHLAPMFCEADSRFFGRPGALVTLEREGTLARGQGACDFRFTLAGRADT